RVRQESGDEVGAAFPKHHILGVGNRGVSWFHDLERYGTPEKYAVTIAGGHTHLKRSVLVAIDSLHSTISLIDLADTDVQFLGQRFDQGNLHGVFHRTEVTSINRELVIFRKSSEPLLIGVDDVSV